MERSSLVSSVPFIETSRPVLTVSFVAPSWPISSIPSAVISCSAKSTIWISSGYFLCCFVCCCICCFVSCWNCWGICCWSVCCCICCWVWCSVCSTFFVVFFAVFYSYLTLSISNFRADDIVFPHLQSKMSCRGLKLAASLFSHMPKHPEAL